MSKSSAGTQTNFLGPHPLAVRLVAELTVAGARVLEIGTGSGRNQRALIAAGAHVSAIEPGETPATGAFDAALSTHALLHGTPATLEAALVRIHAALRPGGSFYATFGSKCDARYGTGTRIAAHVFAPQTGDEIGVAHTYWDEPELRVLLRDFDTVEITGSAVDEIAGSWAHEKMPLSKAFHWMVVARR